MGPQFLDRPVSSLVTIVTELSRLNYSVAYQRISSFLKKKNTLLCYRNRHTGFGHILGIIFQRCWLKELWVLNCREFKSFDGKKVCHKVIISLLFLNFVRYIFSVDRKSQILSKTLRLDFTALIQYHPGVFVQEDEM